MDDKYHHLYAFGEDRKGPFSGRPGEIPRIWFHEQEINVYGFPPISKSSIIIVSVWDNLKLEESSLDIEWITEDGVRIGTRCLTNHLKIKEQLKNNPELAEKIINLLVYCSERNKKELSLNRTLSDDDVSEKLIPFVKQIRVWKEFFNSFSEMLFFFRPSISSDGFYRFFVENDCFKFTIDRWAERDNNAPNSMFWDYPLFDFDPQKKPPMIVENGVYWEIDDKKVAVILPHKYSDAYLADYYNYRAEYDKFLKMKEEKEKEEKEREKRYLKRAMLKEKEDFEKLRKSLLS